MSNKIFYGVVRGSTAYSKYSSVQLRAYSGINTSGLPRYFRADRGMSTWLVELDMNQQSWRIRVERSRRDQFGSTIL